MSNVDNPNLFEAPMYEAFDQAILLAREFAELSELDAYELESLYGDRLLELDDALISLSEGLLVTYSGIGYTAIVDYMGNRETVHKPIDRNTGVFLGLEVTSKHDYQFYDPIFDTKADEQDEEEDYDVMSDDGMVAVLKDWESQLVPAPSNPRLMARFLVDYTDDVDYPVAGSMVLAGSIKTHEAVDLAGFELHDVARNDQVEQENPDTFPDMLEEKAREHHNNLRRKRFRRMKPPNQQKVLESKLSLINKRLGVDRFSLILNGNCVVFDPSINDNKLEYNPVIIENDLIGDCLRVDCMELQMLKGDMRLGRKGNQFSGDSLCLVVELDKDQSDFHELGSTIVWVPILSTIESADFPMHPAL